MPAPIVKNIRGRDVNMVLVVDGRLLFAPTGSIARWNRSLREKIQRAAAREAPANKRPRWNHYGKPLKQTMKSSVDIDTAAMMVHSAVGSTAHYSAFVDQGTGVYAGGSPWAAKTLPPWAERGYRFYEHTWRPGGGKATVKPVMIRGQKGQGFLDAGVKYGFRAMRIPTSTGNPAMIGKALAAFPDRLANFVGNTPVDKAFKAQREIWRAERDEAWKSNREAMTRAADERYAAKKAREAATRDAILADLANSEKSLAAAKLQATKDAAERRKIEQAVKIAATRARKDEAKRIREEKAEQSRAADMILRGNVKALSDARAFYNKMLEAYPRGNVKVGLALTKDGIKYYRVSYTLDSGERIQQVFAYGGVEWV